MPTYDLTSKDTVFVNSDSTASHTGGDFLAMAYRMEAVLDIAKFIEDGYTMAAGDVFQALEIPANTLVIAAGAEVITAFDGTTPTVDIDFAGGDDIVDGGDVSSAGWLASGTNGQAMSVTTGAASTFTQHVTTADTIDVTLNAGASDVTQGVLRVVAVVIDTGVRGTTLPTEATRDQLA